jgi:hypothetical protein
VNPQNNRVLVTLLCVGLGVGALMLFLNLFLWPLQEYDRQINELERANADKEAEVVQIQRDQRKLLAWRWLSLPGVENLKKVKGQAPNPSEDRKTAFAEARDLYNKYLSDLLRSHNVKSDAIPHAEQLTVNKNIPEVNGVPVYTPLRFRVEGRGLLLNIVRMLEEFQATPLLHRVRNLTIKQTPTQGGKAAAGEPLTVTLIIEALVVNGSKQRGDNLVVLSRPPHTAAAGLLAAHQGPGASVALLPWDKFYAAAVMPNRKYSDIALKNIFEGSPPPYVAPPVIVTKDDRPKPRETPDLLTFARLTDVTILTHDDPEVPKSMRATLFDLSTERAIKLRKLPGWDAIPLLKSGEMSTVVWGHVARIDTRGVVFRVQLFSKDPAEESEKLRFKANAIYRLYKTDLPELVKAKVIRTEDAPVTFKVPVAYWKGMIRDGVVRERGGRFAFQHDLVRGQVLKQRDANFVLIRLDERYCSFRDDDEEIEVRPHYGYCRLPVGENVRAALQTPLKDSEVRELQQTVAQAP